MTYTMEKEGTTTFLNIDEETKNVLLKIEPEDFFVSDVTALNISTILDIEKLDNIELGWLRNGIVKNFPHNTEDNYTRWSMIIAVIDQALFHRGLM